MNANHLNEEQRQALVSLTKLVYENNDSLKMESFTITDTETKRTFMINLEVYEVGMMTAGLKGTSKVN